VMAPSALRLQAWSRLQKDLDQHKLAAMTAEIGLNEVIKTAPDILAGKLRGRMVVDVDR
jgi:acrylyl-CoA reductase (NADPH)